MQARSQAAGRRALPAGTLLAFGGGLILYQMTTLMLGAPSSRQLHLSLNIPTVGMEDIYEPFQSTVNVVLGSLAAPAAARSAGHPVITSQRTSTLTPARPNPVPVAPNRGAVLPTAAPVEPPKTQPTGYPLPPVVTVPEQQPTGNVGQTD